jgi:hypothetical protein
MEIILVSILIISLGINIATSAINFRTIQLLKNQKKSRVIRN